MKSYHNRIVFGIGLIAFLAYPIITLSSFSAVAPTKKTGSPGDGNDCSSCHSSFAKETIQNVLSTTIPKDGYTSGETYSITVSGLEAEGFIKYGFSVTSENGLNQKVGSFIAGTNSTVSNNYIGHAPASTDSKPSWTFEWTAPPVGTGDITFYRAYVQANGIDRAEGDKVKTSVLSIIENTTTSMIKLDESDIDIELLDNKISIKSSKNAHFSSINIFNTGGQLVQKTKINSSNLNFTSDLDYLFKGIYFVQVISDKGIITKKIIK